MKVLVSAASRHGATAEIAAAIATGLTATGHEATVLHPDAVDDVRDFDAAVIGSGVYAGSWLQAAEELVDRNLYALREMPVWVFSSGPLGDPPKPLQESPDGLAIAEQLHAREHRTFAGELDKRQLGSGEKVVVAVVRAPSGDFRPWSEILAWARSIGEELTSQATEVEAAEASA
jgi:menaquinone-dependent protoporphyrinogen oxidase